MGTEPWRPMEPGQRIHGICYHRIFELSVSAGGGGGQGESLFANESWWFPQGCKKKPWNIVAS